MPQDRSDSMKNKKDEPNKGEAPKTAFVCHHLVFLFLVEVVTTLLVLQSSFPSGTAWAKDLQ